MGDGPAVGEHESGGGGGEGLDGALGAGVLGVAFEEFEKQDGEEGWGDHGEVAGEGAGGAFDIVADANDEGAVGTGAHAGDGDGGGELGVGDGVMGYDEVLADGGEGGAAGEGGEGGFEEEEVEGEGAHDFCGTRAPRRAAVRRMVTGLATWARPARRAAVKRISASGFLRKGFRSCQALEAINATTAAIAPAMAVATQRLALQVLKNTVISQMTRAAGREAATTASAPPQGPWMRLAVAAMKARMLVPGVMRAME